MRRPSRFFPKSSARFDFDLRLPIYETSDAPAAGEKLFIQRRPKLSSVVGMAEIVVKIPEELETGAKELGEEELNRIVSEALKERLSEEYMFKLADELLKESKLTDERASKLGDELKERVAKKHGL